MIAVKNMNNVVRHGCIPEVELQSPVDRPPVMRWRLVTWNLRPLQLHPFDVVHTHRQDEIQCLIVPDQAGILPGHVCGLQRLPDGAYDLPPRVRKADHREKVSHRNRGPDCRKAQLVPCVSCHDQYLARVGPALNPDRAPIPILIVLGQVHGIGKRSRRPGCCRAVQYIRYLLRHFQGNVCKRGHGGGVPFMLSINIIIESIILARAWSMRSGRAVQPCPLFSPLPPAWHAESSYARECQGHCATDPSSCLWESISQPLFLLPRTDTRSRRTARTSHR